MIFVSSSGSVQGGFFSFFRGSGLFFGGFVSDLDERGGCVGARGHGLSRRRLLSDRAPRKFLRLMPKIIIYNT